MPEQFMPPEKQGASSVKRGYNQALMLARRNLRAALGQPQREIRREDEPRPPDRSA
jgi:hypothetical protein